MISSLLKPTNTQAYTDYQTIGRAERTSIIASQMSTVNDWRQYMRSFAVPNSNVDYSSYRVSYSATDNYGTNFDVWFTMYARGGDNDGAILYNSGWLNGSQSNVPFPASLARGTYVDVYFRIRYPDGVGTNPPTNSDFSRVTFLVTYDERVENDIPAQTTAIPSYWSGTETQTAVSTLDLQNFGQMTTSVNVNTFIENSANSIEYSFATIFGLLDSGESLIAVMNYINDRIPYLYAITFFSMLTAIGVWAIR